MERYTRTAEGKILYKAAETVERQLDDFAKTLTIEEGKTLADSPWRS